MGRFYVPYLSTCPSLPLKVGPAVALRVHLVELKIHQLMISSDLIRQEAKKGGDLCPEEWALWYLGP